MLYNFCTLFDHNYASRGLSLYRSLQRVCAQPFQLTILCMDVETRDALAKLALPNVRLWLVEDIGDAELLEVRKTRPLREFCWTCPGPLMLSMLAEAGPGDIVTYLDADLGFFGDLKPVYDQMGDKDIFIHGHNFPERLKVFEASSGLFNVGLVAIRNAAQGLACLARWRAQCLEICELDPEKGYCGDQKYLDEWPSLYSSLVIAHHPGICLAPWNIEAHQVSEQGGKVLVDDVPLIFYHYHSLRVLSAQRWPYWVVQPARGYDFTAQQRRLIYEPYAQLLRESHVALDGAGLQVERPRVSFLQFARYRYNEEMILVLDRD